MDSIIKSEFHLSAHDNVLTHVTSQPTEGHIYKVNKFLRDNDMVKGCSFGTMVATVPFIMWEKAKRMGYDLDNPDAEIAGKEIHRFLQSEDGLPCKVQNTRKKYFSGGIA